ncbi:nicotinamide mononucleotide transporter [Paenibacillus sp. CCS19]|uniref:nicotinamide riboside transporter PnuC n=1 Tax=Paenibacillus sp. CCS19 TaxID=3158387 RepID=UPI00256AE404|nr:nicotinamide riboside transporter PnuC [Paenibacillus cellulosilyticus]GMK41224.1 nicotinamide mononucleotide transporter [Paenibacillus cellulosilyticus]
MNKTITMAALCLAMLAVAYFTSSTTLEMVATITGLLSVWLTARENIWAWPIGLINVACFFYMFWDVKLYADMTLQVFFFALSIYGWIVWLTKRGSGRVRPTRRIGRGLAIGLLLLLPLVTWGWGAWLAAYTDASIPYADAFIATLSLIAQYLLSYKILENWYCWLLVDVLSVGMYAYKELYAVAFLYVIFLAITATGLYSWHKQWRAANSANVGYGDSEARHRGEIGYER